MITSKKQQLLTELKAIQKQEEKEIIEKHYPVFKDRFEGKYFKRRNSYGGDSKGWWLYTKVTEIKPEHIYDTGGDGVTSRYIGCTFEVDEHGCISINKYNYGYVHLLGELITEREFNAAWDKMIDKINSL